MPSGLGRGLGSLIPQKVNNTKAGNEGTAPVKVVKDGSPLEVDIKLIKPNPNQPRKDFDQEALEGLATSIKTYGVIQPIVVTEKDGEYEIIAGERRLRASQIAGIKKIPVVVKGVSQKKKMEMALIENIQREDLNPIELAMAYRELIDEFKITQEELSKRVGKSRPVIANRMRLLKLPQEIQQALAERKISLPDGLLLAGMDDDRKRMDMFKRLLKKDIKVGDARKEVQESGGTKEARITKDKYDDQRVDSFQGFFSTKASIKRNQKGGGKITLEFGSNEELDEMIKNFGKK